MNPISWTIIVSAIITLVLFLVIYKWTGAKRTWLGILMILLPSVDGLMSSGSTAWLVIGLVIIVAGILIVAYDMKGVSSAG